MRCTGIDDRNGHLLMTTPLGVQMCRLSHYMTILGGVRSVLVAGTTGYPWSGIERHWRDGNIIKQQATVMGWRQFARGRERWICPMYFKIGGWKGKKH